MSENLKVSLHDWPWSDADKVLIVVIVEAANRIEGETGRRPKLVVMHDDSLPNLSTLLDLRVLHSNMVERGAVYLCRDEGMRDWSMK